MILAKIDMQYLLTELGSMMPSGFRFTSLLAIISDLVTVGTFLFPVISPYFFRSWGFLWFQLLTYLFGAE